MDKQIYRKLGLCVMAFGSVHVLKKHCWRQQITQLEQNIKFMYAAQTCTEIGP